MLFEALNDSVAHGELILVEGGLCHFHKRKDGAVTIREIIVLPDARRCGIGRGMVKKATGDASRVVAKCPSDLPSNEFWKHLGFINERIEITRSGRSINVWVWTMTKE